MTNIDILSGMYEVHQFSGGELQVTVKSCPTEVDIVAHLKSAHDIMELMLVVDAIRRMGGRSIKTLHIPYFPYARQDRVCAKGQSLSVKVMADLINSLNVPVVHITDPHSDVTPALINNCVVTEQHTIIPNEVYRNKVVVCPDAGAEKKIIKLGVPYVMATKVRNPETGEIIKTTVPEPEELHGYDYIIIDDICDGGRTFIELAKVLKKHGANSVDLYVTHGIFSNGLQPILSHIDHIYCYNIFNDRNYDMNNLTLV